MRIRVADASMRRVETAVAKAGELAHYNFNYTTREGVTMRQKPLVPLLD